MGCGLTRSPNMLNRRLVQAVGAKEEIFRFGEEDERGERTETTREERKKAQTKRKEKRGEKTTRGGATGRRSTHGEVELFLRRKEEKIEQRWKF